MKIVLVGLLMAAVVSVAWAGGNPDVSIYLSFDRDEKVFSVNPEPFTEVRAYLFLGNVELGATGVWFRINDVWSEYPGSLAPDPAIGKHWPGEGMWGDLTTGLYVGATYCQDEPDELVLEFWFFYLTEPCCIKLLGHSDYGRLVRDCDPSGVGFDYWCVESHASIGGAICPDGDCSQTPVADETWGAVKALYR
jgi:hypothetical protein